MLNGSLAEHLAVMTHKEGTCNSTPLATGWIDTAELGLCCAILAMADMAAETIDFKVQQSAAAGGTNPKDLKVATQLAADASDNDGGCIKIGFSPADLDAAGGFRYVNATAVTGDAVGGVASVSIVATSRLKPVSVIEPAKVLQTKL